jgi:hypothetical protein
MFENMDSEDKYQLGLLLGNQIAQLFEIIAKLDGMSSEEAVDRWVESYIADKIIDATGEMEES